MPHLLATLKNVPLEIIKGILEKEKGFHASNEMYFEMSNFKFRALAQNLKANLPAMIYLK